MISGASGNKEANQLNPIQNNSSQNYAKKIVLASKGESGYSPIFDVDNNGIITLDEFNKYCEENGVKEEDKLKLMMSMQSSKIKFLREFLIRRFYLFKSQSAFLYGQYSQEVLQGVGSKFCSLIPLIAFLYLSKISSISSFE